MTGKTSATTTPRPCPAGVLKCGPGGTLYVRDGRGWKAVPLRPPPRRF